MHEKVNGHILLECDEDILRDDLHMSSKLHRKKLLHVITGECVMVFTSSVAFHGHN